MRDRNRGRGWRAGALLLLLAVCVLMVPAVSRAGMPCQPETVSHHQEAPAPAELTAGGGAGDTAPHPVGACVVAVCPLMHAALVPAAPPAPLRVPGQAVALPFTALEQGIGVPPPLPPPRPSV